MNIELVKYSKDEWLAVSEACHSLVFNEIRPASMERLDFAYIMGDGQSPIGYCTARELDDETLYWQYGGAIPSRRNSIAAVKAFEALCNEIFSKYKRVSTLVSNDNVQYLHLLMKYGFRAIGLRNFKGEIFLEMFKEV